MRTLITNIKEIFGILPHGIMKKEGEEMGSVESLKDAWLLVDGGKIADFGTMPYPVTGTGPDDWGADDPSYRPEDRDEDIDNVIDAEGGFVLPSFCDSHTHIVYAGCRDGEFRDKIAGLTYEEIAARGGGILNSADLLHNTSEEELYRQSAERAREVMLMGTGSLEIKSGYGLTTEDELKMLRVIRRLKEDFPMEIRSTFLGAHAVGRAYAGRQDEYVKMVCREMLPAVAAEGLADFVDVFCDKGFFTPAETATILEAAARYGLRPKIHANELAVSGGVQTGTAHKALSVDHLEQTGDDEIKALQACRSTMPWARLRLSAFPLPLPARSAISSAAGSSRICLRAASASCTCLLWSALPLPVSARLRWAQSSRTPCPPQSSRRPSPSTATT